MEKSSTKQKNMGKLAEPSLKFKESFIEAVKEFQSEGENIYMRSKTDVSDLENNFEKFIKKIKDNENRANLTEGRVPQSELWLVNGNKFIGWVKIRHELNKELLKQGGNIGYAIRPSERKKGNGNRILELALIFAEQLGLSRVLLTCDDDNLGSAKIIENNGGVLENTIENEDKLKRRYWIGIN